MQNALTTSILSRQGRRSSNEDAAFARVHPQGNAAILAVADGMGGAACGEIASEIAIEEVEAFWRSLPAEPNHATDVAREDLIDLFFRIDRRIAAYSRENEEASGMGTTLSLAFLVGHRLYVAHIGDSRICVITSDGRCVQLTDDHSMVAEAVREGRMTEDEARTSPYRHALSRVLDGGGDWKPDVRVYDDWDPEWVLLASSDGFHGVIDHASTAHLVQMYRDEPELTGVLVDAALEAGSNDNVSVACCVYGIVRPAKTDRYDGDATVRLDDFYRKRKARRTRWVIILVAVVLGIAAVVSERDRIVRLVPSRTASDTTQTVQDTSAVNEERRLLEVLGESMDYKETDVSADTTQTP
ncbi:MAG: protein phosphatase 2C domain-containing protein [Rhodothermales bacterium]